MCSLKEAYRVFWIVKGNIAESDQTALEWYNGYFRRLWIDGSNGAPLSEYEEGFESAWKKKYSGMN